MLEFMFLIYVTNLIESNDKRTCTYRYNNTFKEDLVAKKFCFRIDAWPTMMQLYGIPQPKFLENLNPSPLFYKDRPGKIALKC